MEHFPRNWPFVWGIHRDRWIPRTKASDDVFFDISLICAWINDWVNNREAGDLRRHRAHYDVIVMNMEPGLLSFHVDIHVSSILESLLILINWHGF